LFCLGIEEQFYLVWPITLILAFRLRLRILAVIVVVLLSSFAFNLYLVGEDAAGAFYLPLTRFWELMAGGVLACMSVSPKRSLRRRRFDEWASVAGIALVIAAFAVLRDSMKYPGAWALLPTAGAFLALWAGPGAWVNRNILASRVLVPIGLISYPLYLWHWPLLSFGDIIQAGSFSMAGRWVVILASFVLATLTYLLVERPIRFGAKTPAAAFVTAGFLAIAGVAGWVAFKAGGAPLRAANRSGNFAKDIADPATTYFSDRSCVGAGLEQIKNEVCLLSGDHPQILMAGDSHAIALNSAPFLREVPVKTLLIAGNGCLPFVDYVSYTPSEGKVYSICTEVAWQMLGASRSHPEIQNVVLSTRGPLYFSGTAFGVEAEVASRNNWQLDPVQENDTTTTKQERFLRGFSRTISMLEGYGRTVTFVIDVPELGIDPHTCIPGRPLTFAAPTVSPCTVSRTVVDQRQGEYRTIVKALMEEHPKMRVFDPLPLFCDDALCHGKADAHLLYYDTNHLSVYGSQLVWRALLPFVLKTSH
jgi:hypothetical protein